MFSGGYLPRERTLLTLGYRWLADFASWQSQGTLFARILPSQTALAAALAAGFSSERIIALRPPISNSLERALWQQWHITQVVTKASGKAGGEDQKQAIAAELGIRLIRISRPVITYPAQTNCLETAVQFGLTATLPLES
ncbi:MAG: precorrin-6A/cobalt-precorrin-6A reductase [Cyanobacteria bacterium J06636_16]